MPAYLAFVKYPHRAHDDLLDLNWWDRHPTMFEKGWRRYHLGRCPGDEAVRRVNRELSWHPGTPLARITTLPLPEGFYRTSGGSGLDPGVRVPV